MANIFLVGFLVGWCGNRDGHKTVAARDPAVQQIQAWIPAEALVLRAERSDALPACSAELHA
jgi:hypothetical protein